MAAEVIIQHRLDLMVRLIDSTIGRMITERNVRFYQSPARGAPIARGDGIYLFLNIGREDFSMEVRVYGYEPRVMEICYDRLDEQLPIQEVYLLPVDYPVQGEELLSLRGRLPGIQAIEAVSLLETNCCIREFHPRERVMTVLNPHNVRLPHIYYGLVSQDRTTYESFQIEEEISTQKVRLLKPLTQNYQINQPIARIIFGQTEEDGSYLLKVRDSKHAIYLVRYVVDGNVKFQKVDFHHPEEL